MTPVVQIGQDGAKRAAYGAEQVHDDHSAALPERMPSVLSVRRLGARRGQPPRAGHHQPGRIIEHTGTVLRRRARRGQPRTVCEVHRGYPHQRAPTRTLLPTPQPPAPAERASSAVAVHDQGLPECTPAVGDVVGKRSLRAIDADHVQVAMEASPHQEQSPNRLRLSRHH